MDTEKVHGIKHCGVEITSVSNPLNASCDGPEGGHKLWIKGQGGNTNQGPGAALTMMRHSIYKQASQLLCEAVQARVEDGDEGDHWRDSHGEPLRADRWWSRARPGLDEDGTNHNGPHGPCMGIQVNIWERAKTRRNMQHVLEGGGSDAIGYDALLYQAIVNGDAGKLGKHNITSVLSEKVAIFLYEYHEFRFKSKELPPIPDDRSDYDFHEALTPNQARYIANSVKRFSYCYYMRYLYVLYLFNLFVSIIIILIICRFATSCRHCKCSNPWRGKATFAFSTVLCLGTSSIEEF